MKVFAASFLFCVVGFLLPTRRSAQQPSPRRLRITRIHDGLLNSSHAQRALALSYSENPYLAQSPSFAPSVAPDDGTDKKKTLAIVVICMLIVTVGALCWTTSRITELLSLDRAEYLSQFQEDIDASKWFAFTFQGRKFVLFYSTRIKLRWAPIVTLIQFVIGWASFATYVVGLISPENRVNSVLGTALLFCAEVIVHVWYGFLRHPNLIWGCLGIGQEHPAIMILDYVKDIFTVLYHGDIDKHYDELIDYIGFFFVLPMHFFSIMGFFGMYILGIFLDKNDDNRHGHARDGFDSKLETSAIVGAIFGCLCYPFLFLLADTFVGKGAVGILHRLSLEYYEAKLFGKSLREFAKSAATNAFYDFQEAKNFEALLDIRDAANRKEGQDTEHSGNGETDASERQHVGRGNQGNEPEENEHENSGAVDTDEEQRIDPDKEDEDVEYNYKDEAGAGSNDENEGEDDADASRHEGQPKRHGTEQKGNGKADDLNEGQIVPCKNEEDDTEQYGHDKTGTAETNDEQEIENGKEEVDADINLEENKAPAGSNVQQPLGKSDDDVSGPCEGEDATEANQ